MSCGQQALERINVKVDNYFASEIDKYAIKVTMANYPNTIQLGSVVDVDGYKLPKIDLLIGGSPCQSFSFAGKRKGMSTKDEQEILTLKHYLELKSEGYEFEGQSYLFWEYMRLLNECKPTYFLLENVEMGEKWEKVLSKAIGVNGIHINSALVSAQNRKRIYWTNIGMQPSGLFGDLESIIQQPKDKNILLKDILETDVDEKYFLSEKIIAGFERHKERHNDKGTGFGYIPKTETDKGNSLRANAALCPTDNMIIVQDAHNISNQGKVINEKLQKSHSLMARDYKGFGNQGMTGIIVQSIFDKTSADVNCKYGFYTCGNYIESFCNSCDDGSNYEENYLNNKSDNTVGIVVHSTFGRTSTNGNGGSGHLSKDGDKTYCLDAANSMAVELREVKQLNPSTESGGNQPYQQNRVYDVNGISPALNTDGRSHAVDITSRIRRLTPIECERLQTVADNYTAHVSDSQRYKMLGNGWTIDVIAHIFSYLPNNL
jgi:DNA-cytosine methyltransferase